MGQGRVPVDFFDLPVELEDGEEELPEKLPLAENELPLSKEELPLSKALVVLGVPSRGGADLDLEIGPFGEAPSEVPMGGADSEVGEEPPDLFGTNGEGRAVLVPGVDSEGPLGRPYIAVGETQRTC